MMELEELLERVEEIGFDNCTHKEKFLRILDVYPKFKEELKEKISLEENQEWMEKAEKEPVYFIINNDSWKRIKSVFPNSINLNFIGMNYVPVISIDIHERPV